MKKMVVLLLVMAGAFVAYNYFVDVEPATAQDQELMDLEDRLQAARQRFTQATRSAGLSGIDVTADFEAARLSADRIEKELDRLTEEIASDASHRRARKLREDIERFKSRLGG